MSKEFRVRHGIIIENETVFNANTTSFVAANGQLSANSAGVYINAVAIPSNTGTQLSTLQTHAANTSNPHATTAAQVGAYSNTQVDTLLAGYYSNTQIDNLLANLGLLSDINEVTTAYLANDAVTNAKLADMATARIKGRSTAGTGDPEDLTAAQAKTLLGISTADVSGLGALASLNTVDNNTVTANAQIALSKIASIANGRILGNNTGITDVPIALTAAQVKTLLGISFTDISGTANSLQIGTNAVETAAVANDAITNSKLANMATARIKGRSTAGTGDPEDLTAAQVKTLLAITNSDVSGLGVLATQSTLFANQISSPILTSSLVTPSATGPLFLGSSASASGNLSPETISMSSARTLLGIGTVGLANSVSTSLIDNDGVTNAKLANMVTSRIKGRSTAGTGDPEDLTAAQVKTLLAISYSDISGGIADLPTDVVVGNGSNYSRIYMWDNQIANSWSVIHNQSTIGFQDEAGAWIFRVYANGEINTPLHGNLTTKFSSYPTTSTVSEIGFTTDNINAPFFRRSSDSSVQNLVVSVRLSSATDTNLASASTLYEPLNGRVMTGVTTGDGFSSGTGRALSHIRTRVLQVLTGGSWVTVDMV